MQVGKPFAIMHKERLDKLLVARELAATREKAQALIMAGKVHVNGVVALKAGSRLTADSAIEVDSPEHPYVSRGGVKLAAALRHFAIDPAGMTVLDIGASTGGFTDCLLRQGARRVIAVDVGYGQLAWSLRNDERVTVLERTNIRYLADDALGEPVDLAVVDVSFISLNTVLRHARRFLADEGRIVALIKPQFEAGREHVRRGGRVTDEDVQQDVQQRIDRTAQGLGLRPGGRMTSPIEGKKSGNREFLMTWTVDPDRPLEPLPGPDEPPQNEQNHPAP